MRPRTPGTRAGRSSTATATSSVSSPRSRTRPGSLSSAASASRSRSMPRAARSASRWISGRVRNDEGHRDAPGRHGPASLRDQEGHRRAGPFAGAHPRRALGARAPARRGRARAREDAQREDGRAGDHRRLQADPVHAGPRARRPCGHPHLQPADRRLPDFARAGVHQPPARGRDQPRAGQSAERAPRGHAGAAGHDRARDAQGAGPVPRHGDAEPDRDRGRVRAARGAGRPFHDEGPRRVSRRDGRVRRRRAGDRAPRDGRPGDDQRAASRASARGRRRLRRSAAHGVRRAHRLRDAPAGRLRTQGPSEVRELLGEYAWGDDVRPMRWNRPGRLGAPYVREFLEDREITAQFLLDLSPSVDFGTADRRKRDLLIDFTGILARLLTRHGNRVGATMYGAHVERVVPARGGRIQVLRLLNELERRPRLGRAPLTSLSELIDAGLRALKRRSLVFVISDFFSAQGWEDRLTMLARRHETLAVRLVDPRENELPDVGPLILTDSETGEQLWVNTDDGGFRARLTAAARRREQHLAYAVAT